MELDKFEERAFFSNFVDLYMKNNLTISQRNTLDLSINIVEKIIKESYDMEIALQEVKNLIVDIETEANEQIIEQIKISNYIYNAFIETFKNKII
ncbi:hypothetical protein [Staphylococcus equorum]|uniref:hypothetical protein n=1 Tax=Staphylococcus equorum TaxID=246432 RepID=UPI003D800E54